MCGVYTAVAASGFYVADFIYDNMPVYKPYTEEQWTYSSPHTPRTITSWNVRPKCPPTTPVEEKKDNVCNKPE